MARIKPIRKLRLIDMIRNDILYAGVAEGLSSLPVPESIKIGRKRYFIPLNLDEFADSIVYGQRLYFSREEPNDFAIILRLLAGYYFPIVKKKAFNESGVAVFTKNILNCKAKEAYPTTMHMINLIGQLADREKKLLDREPSKIELAAGIEKLAPFAEIDALDFLSDSMKVSTSEVLLSPYNECLVRFMKAKASAEYQERFIKLSQEAVTHDKSKSK